MIAVTGSSGFLGQHLMRRLRKIGEIPFEISTRNGFDIRLLKNIEKIPRFKTLVHLVAKTYVPDSYSDSMGFYHTNIIGTLNCLELCKHFDADIIFASSYVYGPPQYLPVDESHPVTLWNPYATSKIIGEQLCEAYSRDFTINAHVLRIFNMYGPAQDSRFLIPTIMEGVKKGEVYLQNSRPRRDYVYVLDVVKAIEICLKRKIKGTAIYNVGSGVSYSVADIVKNIRKVSGKIFKVKFEDIERASEVPDVVADISKAKKELGWTPDFRIETGLAHMIKWMTLNGTR